MRIQVVFNSTPVLVPCGDGHLTVGELIQKAILRFKKVVDEHPDDVIEVRSLRLADTGSFVDQDDEVAEVLEDREVVILDFEYVPHYVRETGEGGGASISDDSALTPSSQPFSPITLGEDSSGPAHYERRPNHTHSEGYLTTESGMNEPDYPLSEGERGDGEEGEEAGGRRGEGRLDIPEELMIEKMSIQSHDVEEHQLEEEDAVMKGVGEGGGGVGGEGVEGRGHNPEASQDTELVLTRAAWEGESGEPSQEPESPPLTSRKSTWSQDSGYAPKSQESFSHSQPKSLEAYSTSQELSLQDGATLSGGGEFSRDFSSLPHTPAEGAKRPPEKKEEGSGVRGSLRGSGDHNSPRVRKRSGSGSYSRLQRGNDGNFIMSPARSGASRHGDVSGYQPGYDRHPRGADIGGRGGRDHYGGYPGGVRDHYGGYGDREGYLRGHGVPGEFERPYLHPADWRRSYAGGEFDHPYGGRGMYGDIHADPLHMRGRYGGLDAHRGGSFGTRRDRLLDESRMFRAKSHERVDYVGGPRGAYRPDEEFREPPVDYYLSQPTTPHFPYDRPPGFGVPPAVNRLHPSAAMFDPRQMMGGPSGYSLSQPVAYLGQRPMHGPPGDYERVRLLPLQERGEQQGSQRMQGRDRAYSLDEEYDDDEDMDRKDHRNSQTLNPFKRDFRKSIFRDGAVFSNWMERVHEYGIEDGDDENTVPMFEGDISQSQRTPSPQPPDDSRERERGDEESEEDEEFGNVHIIELHKGEEPLGIHLTHYTAPDNTDLGVFIGGMDESGFAAKSEKLKINDRILACNGVDFTKDPFRNQVEELFLDMVAKEPLLRMAVSRGLALPLDELGEEGGDRGEEGEGERGGDGEGRVEAAVAPAQPTGEREGSRRREGASKPDTANVASPNTVTNTRLIGVKHTIHLTKGPRGYGFGITSRDVTTDDKSTPIYVKNIVHEGPAFQDGRLRLGDRILQVDGRGVEGLAQPEVVQLLRQSEGGVTLVISRQEVVEKHEEEEFPTTPSSSAPPAAEPTTVGKTVLTLEIPLYDSGPAGLGVTVFGRAMLSAGRKQGDIGVFIKSVVPGGAAAMDGRLCRGDQLLCINSQSLLGKSNSEALDTLRKTLATATDSGSKIKLVVARKTGINKKQPGMATLEETPIEDETESEPVSHEVGIDIGAEALASQTSHTGGNLSQTGLASQTSHTGGNLSQTGLASQTSHTGLASQTSHTGGNLSQTGLASQTSQTGLGSQTSQASITPGVSLSAEMDASQSSTDMEPRRGILRHSTDSPSHSPKSSSHTHSHKSHTLPHTSSPGTKRPSPSLTRRTQTSAPSAPGAQPSSPGLHKTYLPLKTSPLSARKMVSASGNVMGSGEFDRLEPRLDSVSDIGVPGSQGYGDGMSAAVSVPHFGTIPWSPLDGGDWGRGMLRTPSLNSDLSSGVTSQYSRYHGYAMYPSHPHLSPSYPPSHPHYINQQNYPPTSDAMATGHTLPIPQRMHNGHYDPQFTNGGYNMRGNEAGYPHGYDNSSLRRNAHSNDNMSYSGNDANVSFTAITLNRDMQAPTRGSGRKDRQRSESSLLHVGEGDAGSSSEQSDFYNHTSRSTSHTLSATPPVPPGMEEEEEEVDGSLGDLRLSDSEMSSFRRDDKGRISITKKTKKNPRQDLAHLTLSNTVPLLEGEAGMFRTGSEGCLPEAVERTEPESLDGLEVGPNLGLAKSSSLESLHNKFSHTIKRDVVVGKTATHPAHGPILIPAFPAGGRNRGSFTKQLSKKSQKKSIFKKVFKKKKSSKHKSGKDKSEAVPHDYDTHSLDLDMEGGEAGRERGGQRNTSPDGYDSNDEILATIAKV